MSRKEHDTHVVLLHEIEQVEAIRLFAPTVLKTARLVSLNLDVWAYLRELGYSSDEFNDYIPNGELDRIKAEADRLTKTWHGDWQSRARYRGICIPAISELTYLFFFRDALGARALLDAVCRKLDVDRIGIFGSFSRPGVLAVPSDTGNAVWKYMAAQRGIAVDTIPYQPNPGLVTTHQNAFVEALKNGPRFLKNYLANVVRILDALRNGRKAGVPRVLVGVAPDECARFSAHFAILRRAFQGELILANTSFCFADPQAVPEDGIVLPPLLCPLPGVGYWSMKSRMASVWRSWRRAQESYRGPYPEIFGNAFLDYHFRDMFLHRWPLWAEHVYESAFTLSALRPDLVVTTAFPSHGQAELLFVAEGRGVTTATIPHAGRPNELELPAQHALVWSRDYIRQWQKNSDRTSEYTVIGMPQDALRGESEQATEPDFWRDQARTGQKTCLVCAGSAHAGLLPGFDVLEHRKALKTLLDVPDDLRGKVLLVIKLHPTYSDEHLFAHLIRNSPKGVTIKVLKEGSVEPLIDHSDAVVMVNDLSSVYTRVLMKGKPFIFVQNAGSFVELAFAREGGDAVVRSCPGIWPVLRGVLFPGPVRDRMLSANREFFENQSPAGAKSHHELAKAIQRICARRGSR